MTEDKIVAVEIDGGGRLCIQPQSQDFAHIYRAAMDIGWDAEKRCLFGPKPREWTYPILFSWIIAATADEYSVRLTLTIRTTWINVAEEMRAEMTT